MVRNTYILCVVLLTMRSILRAGAGITPQIVPCLVCGLVVDTEVVGGTSLDWIGV